MKSIRIQLLILSLVFLMAPNSSQAQWVRATGGASGPWVQSLTSVDQGLFVGTNPGGLFRSTDNGNSWTPSGIDNWVTSLVASGSRLFAGPMGSGVYRSTDNGSTWTQINTGLTDTHVSALFISESVSGTSIFAGTGYGGLFRSSDNGATWAAEGKGLPVWSKGAFFDALIVAFAVKGASLFTETAGFGVYRSLDNGSSWNAVISGFPLGYRATSLVVNEQVLFAGTTQGLFRFNDSEPFWTKVGGGIPDSTEMYALHTNGSLNGNKIFASTSKGIFLTKNSGVTWALSNPAPGNTRIDFLGGGGPMLFAGMRGAILRSADDGVTWSEVKFEFNTTTIRSVASEGGHVIAGTSGHGIIQSRDDGASWSALDKVLVGTDVYAVTIHGDYMFAGPMARAFIVPPTTELLGPKRMLD